MAANRPYVFIGNWKMHKTIEEAESFVNGLVSSCSFSEAKIIGLAVPYTAIYPLSQLVGDSALWIGGQNMNEASQGAFTGEIAGVMLKDAGAQFVLLGHSERRQLYGEDNSCINRKMKRAIEAQLRPILCVGETAEQYDSKETVAVVESQLREGLNGLQESDLKNLMIAYEPVWAVGTGNPASPEIVQKVHHLCRGIVGDMFSTSFAENVVIQYGGSVNPENAESFLEQEDVDGLLIGGASLSLATFLDIVNR
jgi:triosephosphate isomerase (TIM)